MPENAENEGRVPDLMAALERSLAKAKADLPQNHAFEQRISPDFKLHLSCARCGAAPSEHAPNGSSRDGVR